LVKQLFGTTSIPTGFQLGRELIARIRDGRLQTRPVATDGWYAHQFHAIAALLAPDTEGLRVGPRYRRELEETFEALFGMNRETHVKQLELAPAGGVPLVVSPNISVEPAPGYYGRVARAYRFVREQFCDLVGEHALHTTAIDAAGTSVW